MSDVTPLRPENEPEDPFEALLDEESDDDFGYVVTRDRANSGDSHPVKLAEWKAQDFASIYTRFRPHLERHARRFLNNQSQVDEVVQDAFLYLMVSLPELDSEIGVLRFLKWKTRLLCLDVIRASGKAYITNIDDVAEPVSTDPEVSAALEQQDDAAVIRLAMSKLNPRHREVLLASMYEEKTTLQIAEQVGLSENATRQLVFRARSAFKKALLGDDVNTEGMSAAAILSVAARKAAAEAKKAGAQAMVFALFLVLAVGALFNFTGRNPETQQLAESKPSSSATPVAEPTATPSPSQSLDSSSPAENVKSSSDGSYFELGRKTAKRSEQISYLDDIYNSANFDAEIVKSANISVAESALARTSISITNGHLLFANFDFAPDSEMPFQKLEIAINEGGNKLDVFLDSTSWRAFVGADGLEHYLFTGSLTHLFDSDGHALGDSPLLSDKLLIELSIEPDGQVFAEKFIILPSETVKN